MATAAHPSCWRERTQRDSAASKASTSRRRKSLLRQLLVGAVLAGEAQRVPEGQAMLCAELGDGLEALASGEDGDGGQGQDGDQGVAAPAGLAGVGDGCQRLDQGQTLHHLTLRVRDVTGAVITQTTHFRPRPTWTRPCGPVQEGLTTAPTAGRMLMLLGIGVTVARLTLDQLV